jgi:hypothetical protein
MAHKVFISFSAKDKSIANSLKRQLAKAGAEVSAVELMPRGGVSPIKRGIEDAIRQSDEVIAIVTRNSAQSQWMSFEIGIAAGLGKKLIPVLVGITPSELPPVLRSFHAINLSEFRQYVGRLSGKLRA